MDFKSYLDKYEISPEIIGKRLGVSRMTIYRLMYKKPDITLSVALKIYRGTDQKVTFEDMDPNR